MNVWLIVELPQSILGLVNCYSDFAVVIESLYQIMIAVCQVEEGETREQFHHY